MSGRPSIEIQESIETLKDLMKAQKTILNQNKVQALYLLKSKQALTVRKTAELLNKGETTIHRWLKMYKDGGIENLLLIRKSSGRPISINVEIAAKIQQELRDPEGFRSYKEIQLWLYLIQDIAIKYINIYKFVKYELKAKLKIPRPTHKKQRKEDLKELKKKLSNNIKALIEGFGEKIKEYSKISYWCFDESRVGLHTVKRRKITLKGVKPLGIHQWNFKYFWLYGAVDPQLGRSFFYEFSHLDKICLGNYLNLLSKKYGDELIIIQMDNAPGHCSEELEIPDNIIILYQPPYCPEVNPTMRLWRYIKEAISWELYDCLDDLRERVAKILDSLSEKVVGFITVWSWLLYSLRSLSLPVLKTN